MSGRSSYGPWASFGLILLLPLAFASPAVAQLDDRWDVANEVDTEAPPPVEEDAPPPPPYGVLFDTGLPDGIQLAFAWRPIHWARFHAGGGHNLASFGLRGGASIIPFAGWISPSVVLEGGYFFEGDLGGTMAGILGWDASDVPESISYAYANLHLGLEMGSDDFTFYLRGGYSYIDALAIQASEVGDGIRFEEAIHVTAFSPSAKLGFVVYFN